MTETGKSRKVLTNREAIKKFLDVGDALLDQFLAMGLPVLCHNGRLWAHADNIEEFFRYITCKQHTLPTPPPDDTPHH